MTEGRRWTAGYYDGQTASRQNVTVSITYDGLRIRTEDGAVIDWLFSDVRRPAHSVSGIWRLEHGTAVPETLVIEDPTFWRVLAAGAGRNVKHLMRRRGLTPTKLIAISIASFAALALLYAWGIPMVATSVASRVPLEWEEGLGKSMVDDFVPENDRCADDVALGAVEQIVNRLTSSLETRYTFRVHLTHDDMINAFAAPGGYLVVNAGLIQATTRAEELGGVLAHEIAHVTNQHGTRAALRQIPIQLLLAAATGEVTGALHVLGTIGLTRYSRGDEGEADRAGMAMMQQAQIDPQGMIDVYRMLEREGMRMPGVLQYLSTHPRTGDRIEELESLIEGGGDWMPLLPDVDWEDVRVACGVPEPPETREG